MITSRSAITIPALKSEQQAGTGRVSARVAGRDVWFESSDVSLVPAPEAFGSALLIPALHHGRQLVIEPAVCPVWAANLSRLPGMVEGWWGYRPLQPRLQPAPSGGTARDGAALCFTLGVDSFYSLLRGPDTVDALVFAAGYDVPLADTHRRERTEALIRAVAAERGLRTICIASNLREVFPARRTSWGRAHGGALAALGHLISGDAGRLVISSSIPKACDAPWGSRWDLDPCFASSRVGIIHSGAEYWRFEKLQFIGGEDIVQRRLRVCWQHLNEDLNCSVCEKCVRTMLSLEAYGHLDRCVTFPGRAGLVDAIDRLPPMRGLMIPDYELLVKQDLRPASRAAVQRLLDRTYAARPPWRLRLRKWWRSLQGRR